MISLSIEDLPDNVAIYRYIDNDIIFVDFNKNAQKLENINKEDLIGKKLLEVFPAAESMGLYEALVEVYKSEKPQELEMKFYEDKRISGWRKNSIRKLNNGDIIVFYKDLSEYKILENRATSQREELEKQYNLLNNIINTVPVRIFWKDTEGFYGGANELFLKDTQLNSLDELIGKTDFEMPWVENDAQVYRDDDLEVINGGLTKINFEEKQTFSDGSYRTILISKVPLRDTADVIIGVLGSYTDITEIKEMESLLLQQQQSLVSQSRLVQIGEMISMIAHQWRQPLAAISSTAIGMQLKLELGTYNFNEKDDSEKAQKEFIESITDIECFVQSLTKTIDDFRNFYKPNNSRTFTKLQTVIDKSLNIIKDALASNHIELTKEYKDTQTLEIFDSELMQVVLNILQNAQENFQDRGIKNALITIQTQEGFIQICDNGGGIEEEIIDKIFDPYFSTKKDKNGTGLGLHMSRTIIQEHHKGKISAQNIANGVCFTIEMSK